VAYIEDDMLMQVPPHNFTHSPVEEVFCRYTRTNGEQIDITIPSPYPGWTTIREQLAQSLEELPNNEGVTSCLLKYTDSFPLFEEDELHQLISIAPHIQNDLQYHIEPGQEPEIAITGSKTGTQIIIWFEEKNDRVLLVFEAMSGEDMMMESDSALLWFDSTRADIHLLFDSVVSDELKMRIR